MKLARILVLAISVLVVGAWAAGSYLLGREEIPTQTSFELDIAKLRELAGSLPGDFPIRVNYQQVAKASLPRAGVFAGESFDPHPMTHGAYQIVYPDGFLMIDSTMGRELFDAQMAGEDGVYMEEGWQTVATALEEAKIVVVTHEHSDHIDGLVAHPSPEKIANHVALNAEQREYPELPEAIRDGAMPLEYDDLLALAPGFVLIRAAGHTPGSQMVYVSMKDGTEWLFLGDVAWHMDQIRDLHYRPRLVTDFFLDEDRAAVMDQFRALNELMGRTEIQLVASHDIDQRDELIQSGRMGRRFESRAEETD